MAIRIGEVTATSIEEHPAQMETPAAPPPKPIDVHQLRTIMRREHHRRERLMAN